MDTKPKIITVTNQKGGCGKSTISLTLADGLLRKGHRVLVIDTDTQNSSVDWAATATLHDCNRPDVISISRPSIDAELSQYQDYDYIVIDSISGIQGFSIQLVASIIKSADLVLIPIIPAPVDIWGTIKTIEMVKQRRAHTGGSPETYFLMNRTRPNTILKSAVKDALDGSGLPVLQTEISQAEIIPKLIGEGKTIFSAPDSNKNKQRAIALLDEIEEIFKYERNNCIA